MCEVRYVDDTTRKKIIACNAEFQKVSRSPYGDDDEIGMLNVIDENSRSAIIGRANPAKVFDLSVDYFVGMPGYFASGDQSYQIWMTHTPQGGIVDKGAAKEALVTASGDGISMYNHCGTHIDTLNHFGFRGRIFNDFNCHDHLGSRAWTKCGPEKHPPVIARGILLDVPAILGVDALPPNYEITPANIDACLHRQKTELRFGDVVLIRTGQMQLWPQHAFSSATPGINLERAKYLALNGVIMIGADNLSLEIMKPSDPSSFFAVHTFLLAQAGIPILENAFLEELANEKLYEFAFVGACIKLRGATGAPMRPIAMPLS